MTPNIQNAFTISENGLSLNEEALILHGAPDPTLAPGQEAPIGSLFLRTGTPELYQKNGLTDTAWLLVNSAISNNTVLPVVQVLRTANQAMTSTFTDLNFDVTDLETDATIIEHDNVNIDRIHVKETGLYKIQYSLSINANTVENIFNFRIRVNDSVVIPVSNREISEDHEINAVSNIFYVELVANDYISLQLKSDGAGDVLWNTCNLSINKADSVQGIPGPAGAGSTVIVKDDGVLLPNAPYSTLNFGEGITVVDNISEVLVTSPLPIFGSEFHQAESLGVTTTTSTSLQQKLLLTTNNVPAGKYRISLSYGWNFNSTGNDFICEIHEDGIKIGEMHRQEPKDSAGNFSGTGSNQRHYVNRLFYRNLNPGVHTYKAMFRSARNGTSASIWDCNIELWRIS